MCLWECVLVCVSVLPGQGKAGVTKANKHSFHWLCDVDPGFLPLLPVRIEPNYLPPCLVRLGATCRQSAGQMDGLPSKLAPSSWARTPFECKTKRNDEAEDELLQGGTGHDDVGGVGVVPAEAVNVRPSLCRTLVPCTIYGTIYYFMSEERSELVDRSLSQPNPSTQTP